MISVKINVGKNNKRGTNTFSIELIIGTFKTMKHQTAKFNQASLKHFTGKKMSESVKLTEHFQRIKPTTIIDYQINWQRSTKKTKKKKYKIQIMEREIVGSKERRLLLPGKFSRIHSKKIILHQM